MSKIYVGLANTCHDTSLALVNERGAVIFAEATERYLQNKRAINIMPDVMGYAAKVLDKLCDPADIVIATSWSSNTEPFLRQGLASLSDQLRQAEQGGSSGLPTEMDGLRTLHWLYTSQLKALMLPGGTLEFELQQRERWKGFRVFRRAYNHHLTHAATACFTSGYREAVCAIVDGIGEGSAFALYRYDHGRLEEITSAGAKGAGSLGEFYAAVCEACGFNSLAGEEWKVMGLAAYGNPNPKIYAILRELIRVEGLNLEGPRAELVHRLAQDLRTLYRKKSEPAILSADVAHVGQQVFEETLFSLLKNLHAQGFSENLVLGGGCALNSSANGRIIDRTPFKSLYVFSAPADDGNAVGAALLAHREDHPQWPWQTHFQPPYLGSSMSPDTLDNVRKFGGMNSTILDSAAVPERAASLLAQGKIIGWIQGRAEFGPRALGNRSILADPRKADIKDALNGRVKFREEFRPFAPSILHEFGHEFFENYQESPYMERTLKFRAEVVRLVPGVVHEDGTGRLQTVKREWNERYYELIRAFYRLTGVPLVINTSFNVMGKPISHSVEDVLAVFCTSGLDAVFIDNVLIQK